MSSYFLALHICHVLIVVSTFPVFCFFSIASIVDVSNESGIEIDYTEDKYSLDQQQGKRSPTSLIPVLQIILLACVQLYFSAPIVACGKCRHFLSTAPSMTCLAYCALLELFLLYMLSCYIIWSGNYPRK